MEVLYGSYWVQVLRLSGGVSMSDENLGPCKHLKENDAYQHCVLTQRPCYRDEDGCDRYEPKK